MDRPSATPIRRYERTRPGELVHVDVNKLGKISPGGGHRIHGRAGTSSGSRRRQRIGYAYLHTAIDDYSRLAYTQVLADETCQTCAGFWRRAEAWFRARGVIVEPVLSDNHFSLHPRSRPHPSTCPLATPLQPSPRAHRYRRSTHQPPHQPP